MENGRSVDVRAKIAPFTLVCRGERRPAGSAPSLGSDWPGTLGFSYHPGRGQSTRAPSIGDLFDAFYADPIFVARQPAPVVHAVYRRALTQDWSLETGYSYRLRREEGEGDAESNTLFLTLQSSFNWRP